MLGKKAKQPIYTDGPSWHISKSGTPTMGGIGFILAMLLSLTLSTLILTRENSRYFSVSLIINGIFALSNGAIGIFDDLTKLKRNKNFGLSPSQKLLLQSALAIAFLYTRKILLYEGTTIYFSFGSYNLGFFYYILSFIAILGTVNCANLTDGIDGLATGVAFAIGASLFYFSAFATEDVAYLSAALMGGAIGFLIFNIHPAKIFMGDTGSLFFGGITAASAFSLGNPLFILLIGIVYLTEGASVILQVAYFKLTGKRLFKMAPIHHHLEKCGFSENKIVICGILLTFLSAILGFMLFV
jgi:phospho-N-acetylmuramoyl-pentapeptide-transferase